LGIGVYREPFAGALTRMGRPLAPGSRYHLAMSLRTYLILPISLVLLGVVYWFLSYEAAGTVLLIVFGGAMALMGIVLLPTLNNVGPTAPVDPEFEDPGR
jgi:hypothetical protein